MPAKTCSSSPVRSSRIVVNWSTAAARSDSRPLTKPMTPTMTDETRLTPSSMMRSFDWMLSPTRRGFEPRGFRSRGVRLGTVGGGDAVPSSADASDGAPRSIVDTSPLSAPGNCSTL